MSKFIATGAALAIAAAWAASAAAESEQKLDAQGRVIRQAGAGGGQVVQTYAQDGALVKREAGRGERIHFDKRGRAEARSIPPKTSAEDKR